MLESTRAKEEAVKKETAEQLDFFRRQQEEADKALFSEGDDTPDPNASGKASSPPAAESTWTINARKRKRTKDKAILKGIKLGKPSTSETSPVTRDSMHTPISKERKAEPGPPIAKEAVPTNPMSIPESDGKPSCETSTNKEESTKGALPGLGLAGYSSDED